MHIKIPHINQFLFAHSALKNRTVTEAILIFFALTQQKII